VFHNHRNLAMESRSPEETRRLAVALSPLLRPGDVVSLGGDLGAGKTTFVQGLAVGLGIRDRVTSPSFVLLKEYLGGRYPLIHMDVYRLERMQEVVDLGYDEFLDPSHIVVVEWGDMVEPLLPKEHLSIQMSYGDDESRREIVLQPRGAQWDLRMQTVRVLVEELFSVDRDDLFLPPGPGSGPSPGSPPGPRPGPPFGPPPEELL
jgi:tRNA threonylcarbamoyladenosine biosynthesis protein TsaE